MWNKQYGIYIFLFQLKLSGTWLSSKESPNIWFHFLIYVEYIHIHMYIRIYIVVNNKQQNYSLQRPALRSEMLEIICRFRSCTDSNSCIGETMLQLKGGSKGTYYILHNVMQYLWCYNSGPFKNVLQPCSMKTFVLVFVKTQYSLSLIHIVLAQNGLLESVLLKVLKLNPGK